MSFARLYLILLYLLKTKIVAEKAYHNETCPLNINQCCANVTSPKESSVSDFRIFPESESHFIPLSIQELLGTGPGEMGKPYKIEKPSPTQEKLIKEGFMRHQFNEYISDQISVHRSLPDYRNPWCKKNLGQNKKALMTASVVICFYNEALSVLLRTINSVLRRSPANILREIILIDDNSNIENLGTGLDIYIRNLPTVKLIRSKTRLGLIKARMLGAKRAQGPVLVFLDSHVEATKGWLEPLVTRIKENWTNVVCPIIDVIDDYTLEYKISERSVTIVGGFNWNLMFVWKQATDDILRALRTPADPVPSPTMAGGLFAIHKSFFNYLGQYDDEYEIWGAENLEISFKIWMCGGRLEVHPCSRLGHIYRKRSPYSRTTGTKGRYRNYVRLAAVWLDEYAKYFYERIGNRMGDYGNITSRVALKKSLKCKPFDWYIKNIYPDIFHPKTSVAHGEIRNEAFGGKYCLDTLKIYSSSNSSHSGVHLKPIGWPCHQKGGNQFWYYTDNAELRQDNFCLDFAGNDKLHLYPCHGKKGNQRWMFDVQNGFIFHPETRLCLTLDYRDKLSVMACEDRITQRWTFGKIKIRKLTNVSMDFKRS